LEMEYFQFEMECFQFEMECFYADADAYSYGYGSVASNEQLAMSRLFPPKLFSIANWALPPTALPFCGRGGRGSLP
jgi:hypothetical protein